MLASRLSNRALGWTVVGSLVAAPIDGLVVFPFGCESKGPVSSHDVPSLLLAGLFTPIAVLLVALPISLLVFFVLGTAGVVAGLSRSRRIGAVTLVALLAASMAYVDGSGASLRYGDMAELPPELVRWGFLEHTLVVVLAPLLFWSGSDDLQRLASLEAFKR